MQTVHGKLSHVINDVVPCHMEFMEIVIFDLEISQMIKAVNNVATVKGLYDSRNMKTS
jgi:hypothetical protein